MKTFIAILLLATVAFCQAQQYIYLNGHRNSTCTDSVYGYISIAKDCTSGACIPVGCTTTGTCTQDSDGNYGTTVCAPNTDYSAASRNPLQYAGAEIFVGNDCSSSNFVLGAYAAPGEFQKVQTPDPDAGKYRRTQCTSGRISSTTCTNAAGTQGCATTAETNAYTCIKADDYVFVRLTCDASHGTLSFALLAFAMLFAFVANK